MKTWQEAAKSAIVPGLIAGALSSATASFRGRRETGSAIAPINATSHVLWGDRAAKVERPTLRHSAVGYAINSGAAIFWSAMMQKMFGRAVDRRGPPTAFGAAIVTAILAYITDYKLVPRRLTPGYEQRVSKRSLGYIYGVLALGLAVTAIVVRRR